MNLETQKLTKRIEIHQSEITIHDLPKRSVKMIDGSEKRNRQVAFELQNSHVCEKRSKHAAVDSSLSQRSRMAELNFGIFSDLFLKRHTINH